ncbi:fungal-specific transcription factor domain-containing protein [Phycomyces nitens]|nr:fungal-specific transcription factor domain-containing protein [Phycomyces nitens]
MERILGGLSDTEAPDDGNPKKKVAKKAESSDKSVATQDSFESATVTQPLATDKNNEEIILAQEPKPDEKPLAVGLSSISNESRTRYVGEMSPLPLLAHKIDFEDSRFTSQFGMQVRRFGQSLVFYDSKDQRDGRLSEGILRELGILGPSETIKGMNDWIYKVSGLDKQMSDRLMKIYFLYIHPGLPVINKKLFLKQYRGNVGDYPSAPLLNAIYGAAVRYIEMCKLFGDKAPPEYGNDRPIPEGWSEKLFNNLIVYVKGRYNPCISTIQAIVIGHNHRASVDGRATSGWLLNSAAQDLGLHRSSEKWDIPESEKETRKRVWWAVYIMDKWSSAGTGRPQTIFDEASTFIITDCDEEYPCEAASWDEVMDTPDETETGEESGPRFPSLDTSVARKIKGEKIPIYQPFVQLVKLSEILGKVLQGLYTPKAKKHSALHGSDSIISYLDGVLSEWKSALPPALQISNVNVHRLDSRGQTPLLSMSGLIYLSYCTLLILLHRPFIEKNGEQKTRSSLSSLSICTSAATRCTDIAEKMHYRDFLLVSWNFAIYPIFTAAVIHIYNAANPDSIVSEVARANLVRSVLVIKRLSKMTHSAERLYNILIKLMEFNKIPFNHHDLSDQEEKTAPDGQLPKKTHITYRKKTPKRKHVMRSSSESQNDNSAGKIYRYVNSGQLIKLWAPSNPYSTTNQTPQVQHQNDSQNQQQRLSNFNMTDFGSMYSMQPHLFQAPVVSSATNLENTFFRNRPDNPFWSVPSSIEFDDWAAYLLPEEFQQGFSTSAPPKPPSTQAQSQTENRNNSTHQQPWPLCPM